MTGRHHAGPAVFIGIDVGTSGCRAAAIDQSLHLVAEESAPLAEPVQNGPCATQDPQDWWLAVCAVLGRLRLQIPSSVIVAMAVAGTSGTCLLCDREGRPLTPGLMYRDTRAWAQAQRIAEIAACETPAQNPTSSLSKFLWWTEHGVTLGAHHLLHQADWIAGQLCGRFGVSDYHNCLKLGFDAQTNDWPYWLGNLPIDRQLLPQVVAPGTPIGTVGTKIAQQLGLPADLLVAAGTTDSIAAFLATGADRPGDAVSSYGSTLALKLLTDRSVASAPHGVYSHRLGRLWLAGGASNAGGATLARYFAPQEMDRLSARIDPERATGLHFYPLPGIGERFPIADPQKRPKLTPRPRDRAVFFQAMLEGLADIEACGYELLTTLGAGPVRRIWTSGRTGRNPALRHLRERRLGVPILSARFDSPAAGVAVLAGCAIPGAFPRTSWDS